LISTKFKILASLYQGFLTKAYGPGNPLHKSLFLEAANSLGASINNEPWIVRGDFNLITSLWDKKGGIHKLDMDITTFKDTINKLRLIYL
jgi:hypothetical protein